MKFTELNLPEKIMNSLDEIGYKELTPVQELVIPVLNKEKDVLACSRTGSGKTMAFLIPVLSKLINDQNSKAIVIAPTRELAMQIMDNVELFIKKGRKPNKSLLIGGAPMSNQLLSIKKHPRLIIGTPGRINDFLNSKKLKVSDFNILVLDEMDRMLDMGFSIQIDNIVKNINQVRQTMLFSATISKKIEKTTEKYLNNPEIIKLGDTNQPSLNVSQEIIKVENNNKFELLLKKLKGDTVFTLVFMKTKYATERLAKKLEENDIIAKAVHGDFKQNKRAKIIQSFRDKKFNVLVATDVAARGLDITHIDTVINYDLPQCPEDYIHRIGRCSRGMDIKGTSISFCSKNDVKFLNAIKSLIENGDYSEEVCFDKTKNKKNFKKTKRSSFKKRSKSK